VKYPKSTLFYNIDLIYG